MSVPQPEKVLILRFSALGDVILTSPAIEALRNAWPRTRILYAVKARLASVVQHNHPHRLALRAVSAARM